MYNLNRGGLEASLKKKFALTSSYTYTKTSRELDERKQKLKTKTKSTKHDRTKQNLHPTPQIPHKPPPLFWCSFHIFHLFPNLPYFKSLQVEKLSEMTDKIQTLSAAPGILCIFCLIQQSLCSLQHRWNRNSDYT